MYVCMCVCVHICMCLCVSVCIYVCMYVCMYYFLANVLIVCLSHLNDLKSSVGAFQKLTGDKIYK